MKKVIINLILIFSFFNLSAQTNFDSLWGDTIIDRKFNSLVDDSYHKSNGFKTKQIIEKNGQPDLFLVWADEFDGKVIDTTKWYFEIFGSCWDNVHWNTDSPKNARLNDGKLQIIASKDKPQTQDEIEKSCDGINLYTSAYIVTQNKAAWRYGRIEARIKLPYVGKGFVPAFWMKPADEMYGWWPYSGSIEIMEHPTNEFVNIYGTIDTKNYSYLGIGHPETHRIQIPDAETAFHTYAIEWSKDTIDFYVDDNKYFSFINDQAGFGTWPFDEAFYIILDVAVGGGWVGNPDENTVFPAIMEVDYVRVFQKLNDIQILGKDAVTLNSKGISYSVPLLDSAGYSWTVSPGALIVSGQNTNQIKVDWGSASGNVTATITIDSNSQIKNYPVEVSDNLIKNPGFEKGGKYWNSNVTDFGELNQPKGSYEFVFSPLSHTNSTIKINIPKLISVPWDFQLSQIGFEMEYNNKYDVSFWAKSNVSGNKINATIVIPKHSGTSNFVLYGQEFILTNQWAEYTFSFTANEGIEGALNIDMGYQVGTFYFDDFSLFRFNNKITPVFTQIRPLCQNSIPPILSVVSNDGIKGKWSPATVNTSVVGKSRYTFTPNDEQSAIPVNIDIEIMEDKISPEAICRNITVYLDVEAHVSITSSQIDNSSKDNCKLDTLYLSRYDFNCNDIGKTQVTLTAIDAVGLFDICEAIVTVLDTIKPVVRCREQIEMELDKNDYKPTLAEVLLDASDTCGIDTLYFYPHELDCNYIGLSTITLWAVGVNGDSSYCTTRVTLLGNRPPTVVDDSVSTIENVPVVIEAITNDYDEKTSIDISTITVTIQPLHGMVTINPGNGDFTYTPDLNFSGVDILQYRVCDDGIPCEPECGNAFVYIIVKPVNIPPVAVDDYYSTTWISYTRNVLENDYDIDSEYLTVNTNPLSLPNHGELIIYSDGIINYIPNEGYIGADSFKYIICDDGIPALCDSATVSIDITSNVESNPLNKIDCKILPNPNDGIFNIEIFGITDTDIHIDILNDAGSVIKKFQFEQLTGFMKKSINLRGLASGKYYLIINSGLERITKEVIVN